MSCFSGYQIRTGEQYDGKARWLDVPIIYGNMSRLGAFILRGGSDGSMSYIPVGALNMITLKRDDSLRRTPYHVEKFNYVERAVNPEGVVIAGVPGKKMTMERFMPVQHEMGFEVSFWCSNDDQVWQLVEQIGALYAVQMDFLQGNSPSDWTNINWMMFSGEYQFGQAKLEGGSEQDPYKTVTFPFTAGIWLGMPAKVYETKYIEEIQVPIYQLNVNIDWETMPELDKLVIRPSEHDLIRFENIEAKPGPKPTD